MTNEEARKNSNNEIRKQGRAGAKRLEPGLRQPRPAADLSMRREISANFGIRISFEFLHPIFEFL